VCVCECVCICVCECNCKEGSAPNKNVLWRQLAFLRLCLDLEVKNVDLFILPGLVKISFLHTKAISYLFFPTFISYLKKKMLLIKPASRCDLVRTNSKGQFHQPNGTKRKLVNAHSWAQKNLFYVINKITANFTSTRYWKLHITFILCALCYSVFHQFRQAKFAIVDPFKLNSKIIISLS
jgi:hypothetical protein